MWVLVLFDLPVETSEQRKEATDFRNTLLDFGFEMCQFSCYLRFVEGREQADTWTKRISHALPAGGKVYVLCFTDKQYEGIVRFEARRALPQAKNPPQFQLF
jgi:CRISPR-associated protein Cas2